MRLPSALDAAYFEQVFRSKHAAWREAVSEVCAAHGVAFDELLAVADGSNLVACLGDRHIVKIFPPFHQHQWESERRALRHLRGAQLPVEVPALIAEGTRDDGWHYVIMSKLPGSSLHSCWTKLHTRDRARLLEQVGSTMAAVHALPLGDLATLPPAWSVFLQAQKANCRQRHADLGAPAWFVQGVDELVKAGAPEPDGQDRVLLTGEYTPFNLLVQRADSGWQLTGMIDFGDAMVGPRDYDLLGPAMFSCRGEARLVQALLRGYFGEERVIDAATRSRLMALAVLHRYSNFDVQLCIPHWRERAGSFEALAELVWP